MSNQDASLRIGPPLRQEDDMVRAFLCDIKVRRVKKRWHKLASIDKRIWMYGCILGWI